MVLTDLIWFAQSLMSRDLDTLRHAVQVVLSCVELRCFCSHVVGAILNFTIVARCQLTWQVELGALPLGVDH